MVLTGRRCRRWSYRVSAIALCVLVMTYSLLIHDVTTRTRHNVTPVKQAILGHDVSFYTLEMVNQSQDQGQGGPGQPPPEQNSQPSPQGIQPQFASAESREKWSSQPLLAGTPRTRKVSLTVGMVTVHRGKGDYLSDTLASFIYGSEQKEREEMTIVVMLADRNDSCNDLQLNMMKRDFAEYLEAGLLLVIGKPDTEHLFLNPPTKRTYNDSLVRVQWRAKQNLDYAALMEFCTGLSRYYMQTEDDVVVSTRFVSEVLGFVTSQKNDRWALLDVHPSGFIGKVFHSHDLPKMAAILRSFYLEQPCDFLINHFRGLMLQKKSIILKGKLMFHKGKYSSLTNVTRNVDTEKHPVMRLSKQPRYRAPPSATVNPPAHVVTSMAVYKDHYPHHAYDSSLSTFFWASDVSTGDYVTVVFDDVQNIRELVLTTGFTSEDDQTAQDRAEHARLDFGKEADLTLLEPQRLSKNQAVCTNTTTVGHLKDGLFSGNFTASDAAKGVKCVNFVITQDQKSWLVIQEISVIV